jgi:hypothetical protein
MTLVQAQQSHNGCSLLLLSFSANSFEQLSTSCDDFFSEKEGIMSFCIPINIETVAIEEIC